jgi:hypothetical protein
VKTSTKIKLIAFIIFSLALFGLRHVFYEALEIDRCLDSGGKYDKETASCITK